MSRAVVLVAGVLQLLGRAALLLAVLAVGFGLVRVREGRPVAWGALAAVSATALVLSLLHVAAARRVAEHHGAAARGAGAVLAIDLALLAAGAAVSWPVKKEALALLGVGGAVLALCLVAVASLPRPPASGDRR